MRMIKYVQDLPDMEYLFTNIDHEVWYDVKTDSEYLVDFTGKVLGLKYYN